jgi:hypothetical protein
VGALLKLKILEPDFVGCGLAEAGFVSRGDELRDREEVPGLAAKT